MKPWLYLLSTICAHSCNFPTPQVMLTKMIGKRTTVMSTRLGVNQSTVSLCGASVESVVYFLLSLLYKTMWFTIVPRCNNTAMVYLRFVYLYVRLFLEHIWVFYASYFILKIWVWHLVSSLWAPLLSSQRSSSRSHSSPSLVSSMAPTPPPVSGRCRSHLCAVLKLMRLQRWTRRRGKEGNGSRMQVWAEHGLGWANSKSRREIIIKLII